MRPATLLRASAFVVALPLLTAAAAPAPSEWGAWSTRIRALYYLDANGEVAPLPAPAARYFAAAAAQRNGLIKQMRADLEYQQTALPRMKPEARFAAEPGVRIHEKKIQELDKRVKAESDKNLRPDYNPSIGVLEVGAVGWMEQRVVVVAIVDQSEMVVRVNDKPGTRVIARGWPTAGLNPGARTSLKTPALVTGTEDDSATNGKELFVLEPFNPDPYARTMNEDQFRAYLKRRNLAPAALLEHLKRLGHRPNRAGVHAAFDRIEQSAPAGTR